MKKYSGILCILFISTGFFASGQTSPKSARTKVPSNVLAAFQKDYHDVKRVTWDMEKENYEAEFVYDKQNLSVTYDAMGKKLETEISIQVSQLPAEVQHYISSKKLGKIKEASKILKANGNTEYEAEVGGGDYIFDQDGKFLKKEKA